MRKVWTLVLCLTMKFFFFFFHYFLIGDPQILRILWHDIRRTRKLKGSILGKGKTHLFKKEISLAKNNVWSIVICLNYLLGWHRPLLIVIPILCNCLTTWPKLFWNSHTEVFIRRLNVPFAVPHLPRSLQVRL